LLVFLQAQLTFLLFVDFCLITSTLSEELSARNQIQLMN